MEGNENPGRRISRDPDPAPATPIEKPATGASDRPLRSVSPFTPFSPASVQRSVLLFDWWLIKVENGNNQKRLAVGGLTTRGQFATRVFSSAPIAKRYDAYTLETEDRIIVRIQGLINRARMHHYGFPPEVCRRFLTGFPYNWDGYADDFFVKRSTAESIPRSISGVQGLEKDSTSNSDSPFPINIDEFPLNRVLDVLKFCDSPVDDVMASNMTNALKKFTGHHASMDPTTRKMASDVLLEKAYDLKKIESSHNFFPNSSMDDSLPGRGSGVPRKILLGKAKEPETDNHQSAFVQGNLENFYQMHNVTDGNLNDKSVTNIALVAMEIGIAPKVLDVSDLKDGEELRNGPLEKEHDAKNLVVYCRNNSQSRKAFDSKDVDFLDAKLCESIGTSLAADVANSLEKPNASDKKQKTAGQGSRKRLSKDEEKASSVLHSNHAEEELRNSDILKSSSFTSGISNQTSLEDINDACVRFLEKINNCFGNTVMSCTAEVGSVADVERAKTSEAELCLRRSPIKLNVQDNIQKDHKFELNDGKINTHSSTVAPPESVLDHSEEKSRSNSLCLTEEEPSTDNGSGHIHFGTKSVSRRLRLSTPKGQKNSCIVGGSKLMEEIGTNFEPRILRSMQKKLNTEQKDNEMEKLVLEEDVRKNVVRSVPVDQSVTSVTTDTGLKINNCFAEAGSVADAERAKTSEAELCLRRSPIKLNVQDNIQKDHKFELNDGKINTHSSTVAPPESVLDHSEEKSKSNSLCLTEEEPSTDNGSGHIHFGTKSVSRRLRLSTPKGQKNRCIVGGSKLTDEIGTKFEPRILRSMQKKLNTELKDNEMEKLVLEEDVRKNVVRSVPVDQSVASVTNDTGLKINNCFAEAGSVADAERAKTSEAELCLRRSPIKLNVQDNIQKDHKFEHHDGKINTHSSTVAPPESVLDHSEEKSRSNSVCLTEEEPSTDNCSGHIYFGTKSVSRRLRRSTPKGQKNRCIVGGSKLTEEIGTKFEPRILRSMQNKLNTELKDNEMEKLVPEEDVRKNVVRSVPVDQSVASVTNDTGLKINNCFAEAGSVADAERAKTSEAELCLRRSPIKLNVQNNIQKDHKFEHHDGKINTHSSTVAPPKSLLDHSEEKSRSNSLCLTEEEPSTDNGSGHIHFGTKSVSRRLRQSTPKGQKNSCFVGGGKLMEEIGTKFEPRILRSMQKKLNTELKDNEMEKLVLEDVRKNVVRSVPVDQSVASVTTDTGLKTDCQGHVQEIDENRVQKGIGRIRKKEQHIEHYCQGPHSDPSSAPCEIQLGDRHINDHIRMKSSDKGKSFQFSVGCDTKPASQSGPTMEGHTTKNNAVGKTKNRRKRGNHQPESQNDVSVELQSTEDKASKVGRKKKTWTPSYPSMQPYATQDMTKKLSFTSPEDLNLRRSRSGRLLVPVLSNWCQHLIYDMDGTITGITGVDAFNSLSTGNKSEPKNKKRRSS